MILTCPDCATRYLTKPEAIGPNGRTVRCASCTATWFVSAPDLSAKEPELRPLPVEPEKSESKKQSSTQSQKNPPSEDDFDEADDSDADFISPSAASVMRDQADAKRAMRRKRGVGFMWISTLAALSAAALAAYIFRVDVVERFPKSATVYDMLGMEVAQGGLLIDDVITRSAYIEGAPTLIVEGQVRNPDRNDRESRLVQLSLHDPAGSALTQWQVELPKAHVTAGETLKFVTQYPNPPIDAVSLRYVFAGDLALPSDTGRPDMPLMPEGEN